VRHYPANQYPYVEINAPLDGTVQRENAGFIGPGQTKVAVNLDKLSINAAAILVPLLTVPAGKSFQITDLWISHDGTSAVRMGLQIGVGTNAVTIFSFPIKGDTAPLQLPGIETQEDVPAGSTLYFFPALLASANVYVGVNGAAVLGNAIRWDVGSAVCPLQRRRRQYDRHAGSPRLEYHVLDSPG